MQRGPNGERWGVTGEPPRWCGGEGRASLLGRRGGTTHVIDVNLLHRPDQHLALASDWRPSVRCTTSLLQGAAVSQTAPLEFKSRSWLHSVLAPFEAKSAVLGAFLENERVSRSAGNRPERDTLER
jgi:hypothetical protein